MFLQPDGTFIIQLINFAIFFAILNVIFLKPVGAAIRKRRDYINGVAADYAKYQASAKELRERAEAIRAEARREAEQRIAKARADVSNQTAEMSSQYAEQVSKIVEEAHAKANAELERARAGEEQLVDQLSSMMVDRALGGVSR
jgi:F-type H+-transporting ATPase subunit b